MITGVRALDKSDEGFASIHLNVKLDGIYKCFKKLINDYEIWAAAGFKDTLLRCQMKKEVANGDEKKIQPGVQA